MKDINIKIGVDVKKTVNSLTKIDYFSVFILLLENTTHIFDVKYTHEIEVH